MKFQRIVERRWRGGFIGVLIAGVLVAALALSIGSVTSAKSKKNKDPDPFISNNVYFHECPGPGVSTCSCATSSDVLLSGGGICTLPDALSQSSPRFDGLIFLWDVACVTPAGLPAFPATIRILCAASGVGGDHEADHDDVDHEDDK